MIDLRAVLIAVLALSAGCSKFKAGKEPVDPAFFSAGDGSLNPPTDKLAGDCFKAAEFDACIFMKNPVAQERGAVSPAQAGEKRRFGVKIRGLAPSGFLENARVQVYSLYSPRFTLKDRAQLKSAAYPEAAAQFSAYYWSNRMFDYLGGRLQMDLPLQGLKIYVDDAFTGYSAPNKSIHLAKKENELPRAYSGEVIIHLTAQALADAISGGKLFAKDFTKHNFCALDPKGCCTTDMGCAQALGSGFGEFVAAMMFPDSARAGESTAQSSEGQKICSVSRDLVSLSAMTRAQVFNACAPKGRAALMGAWYASLWWKLRAQTEAQEAGAGADIDKLFFAHAKAWTSLTDFAGAKAAAISAAQAYKSGLYTASVTAAFSAAGL